jgi:uncharacterized protein YbjT (DUF2867 family)
MRILVTGAYGLIGSAVLARIHRDGHALVGAGRSIGEARRRFAYAQWVEADFTRLTTAQAWRTLLTGVDAVVNCVGVLQDSSRDDVRRVQVEATGALFEACAQAGIRRVIHVSAMSAEREGATAFSRTKGEAEDHLRRLDLDWVILRPGLVLASAVYGGSALLRGLAGLPLVTPLVAANARVQVASVEDVAETVAFCLGSRAPARVTWDIADPDTRTLGEIVVAMRRWLGLRPARVVRLPASSAWLVGTVADALGWLGWRSPARSTALAQLAAGVVGDPAPWMAATGMAPASFADILARRPAGVQDRWFARLYLLKPVAVATLALFWIGTGLVALGPGRASAGAELAATGFPAAAVGATVVWGAWFDIVMGLALLWRRISRAVLNLMLIVTPLYLLTGTLLAPRLWIDPLGPLLKILPMLLATAFTLAILDER